MELRSRKLPEVSFKINAKKQKLSDDTIDEKQEIRKYQVSLNNFKFIRMIGRGYVGRVWLARKLDGVDKGQLYAIKSLKKIDRNKNKVANIKNERNIMVEVRGKSTFFVSLHYAFETADKMYLVMDYIDGGDLFVFLFPNDRPRKKLSETMNIHLIAEIYIAMKQLHELNIIYRDLKLENLLITKKGHIVLCDFGLSCKLANGEKTAKGFVGTIYYMSPELLTAESYNKSVDYWSLGILTCEFCFAKHPFDVENGCTAERAYCLLKLDPDIPKNLNDHTKDFIKRILSHHPKDRLGCNGDDYDFENHEIFKSICWEEIKQQTCASPLEWKDTQTREENLCSDDPEFEYDEKTYEQDEDFLYVAPHLRVKVADS